MVEAVVAALDPVVLAQRAPEAREQLGLAARDHEGRLAGQVLHQVVHVLQLAESGPARVARPPFALQAEPDRERLGEILVRVALRVPRVEVEHEALAVRPGRVVLGVGIGRAAEQLLSAPAPPQAIGVLDGVTGLVAQDPEAPLPGPALYLEHLALLQPGEPRMGEIERNRHPGHAVRAEPLVGQPVVRAEAQAPCLQLAEELGETILQPAAVDREVEIAQAKVEELLVVPAVPDRRGEGPARPSRRRRLRAGAGRARRRGRRGAFGRRRTVGGAHPGRLRLRGARVKRLEFRSWRPASPSPIP